MGYRPLTPHVDLPAMEHDVHPAVEKPPTSSAAASSRLLTAPAGASTRVPRLRTACPVRTTSRPVSSRTSFPRYRTMRGYHVPRMAGWDCHGLPVELAVEKELGFTGKPDIEAYGIAEFNAKCRENVQQNVDAFRTMSERMGYWVRLRQRLLGRWTRNTSRACGGRFRRSSTRACWLRITASRPTARAVAPGCPITRSPRVTRT